MPDSYAEHVKSYPPLWISAIGFSGHGKSTYLAALTMVLDQLAVGISSFMTNYLDQQTLQTLQEIRARSIRGEMVAPTQMARPTPLVLQVEGELEANEPPLRRTLSVYDTAGEHFKQLSRIADVVPALPHLDSTWFVFSVADFDTDEELSTIADLFQSYRAAIESAGKSLANQQIVVVFTKCELIQDRLPSGVIDYLQDDPFVSINDPQYEPPRNFSLSKYLDRSAEISDQLHAFTGTIRGGQAFLNMAKRSGVRLRFAATTALGSSPDADNVLRTAAQRFRVLDPLFWSLLNDRPIQTSNEIRPRFHLVVDGTKSGEEIYGNLLSKVCQSLKQRGDTSVWSMGSMRPIAHQGQSLPESPPNRKRHPLIGPVLDVAPADTYVLLLTASAPRDLQDFRFSPWKDRMLIGVLHEKLEDIWPHTYLIRPGDDVDAIAHRLLNLHADLSPI
ncbi:MAG: hypothetical protein AAFP90_07130 [Planctomycetota bacterium]